MRYGTYIYNFSLVYLGVSLSVLHTDKPVQVHRSPSFLLIFCLDPFPCLSHDFLEALSCSARKHVRAEGGSFPYDVCAGVWKTQKEINVCACIEEYRELLIGVRVAHDRAKLVALSRVF